VVEWLLVTTPVLALAVNCGGYLLLRHGLRLGLAATILGGLAAGLAAIIAAISAGLSYSIADPWELAIGQVGTYLGLSFCYWTFLNLNITSLRIRVLRDLLKRGGAMPLTDLLASYPDEERLQRRLDRLAGGGQIASRNGRWVLRSPSPLLMMARCFEALRWAMGLAPAPDQLIANRSTSPE